MESLRKEVEREELVISLRKILDDGLGGSTLKQEVLSKEELLKDVRPENVEKVARDTEGNSSKWHISVTSMQFRTRDWCVLRRLFRRETLK